MPSTPAQRVIPFGKCNLLVRPEEGLDTHFLGVSHEQGVSLLAEHPNGHSLLELAKCLATGDAEKTRQQWQYVQDCGGMCRSWSVFEHYLGAT